MGDLNQLLYVKALCSGLRGRVLEIGSKNYGSTQPFRSLFKDSEYVGIDLEAGDNVDLVVDLEQGTGTLPDGHFDLIIACSVLEHSSRPWIIAANLQKLLSTQGALLSCHPWVWRYHKYPDDYFRFSPKGIASLFPQLTHWLPMLYSTNLQGEFFSFSDNDGTDNLLAKIGKNGRKYLPYLQTLMAGTASPETFNRLNRQYAENLKPRSLR